MTKLKVLAAAVTTIAALSCAPAHAFERQGYGGPGFVAGAAIGTAGAIASAPFRDSYAYYGDGYANSGGYGRGYRSGYGTGYRNYGNSPNSTAGAGGYNTGATEPTYNW